MWAGLDMDGQKIGARPDEGLDVALGLDDHQMHVERQPRALAYGLDDGRADGEVGHEAAVHDVHVELVGAARLDAGHGLAQRGEIGGENAWRDLHPVTTLLHRFTARKLRQSRPHEPKMGAPLSRSRTACLKPTSSQRRLKAKPSGLWRVMPSKMVAIICVVARPMLS